MSIVLILKRSNTNTIDILFVLLSYVLKSYVQDIRTPSHQTNQYMSLMVEWLCTMYEEMQHTRINPSAAPYLSLGC